MSIISYITTLVKLLGSYFFTWCMPFAVIVLNIIKDRDIFELNVVIAFILGLIINIIWDLVNVYLEKKEYHKYYL